MQLKLGKSAHHGSSPGQNVRPGTLNSSEKTRLYVLPSYPVREYALVGVSPSIKPGSPVMLGTWPGIERPVMVSTVPRGNPPLMALWIPSVQMFSGNSKCLAH